MRILFPAALVLAGMTHAVLAQDLSRVDPAAVRPFEAHVVAVQGDVAITRDHQPWMVSSGSTIPVQQVIKTGKDGYARLTVQGGAYFELYANSRVAFRSNPGDAGDLLDVLDGHVKIHLNPGPGQTQQRIFCRSAIITARQASSIAVAVDEDSSVRIDVLEGQIAVQHALLPRSTPTIVKAIDAIVVEKDEQLSRRLERGTLYRYTVKPLHDLYEVITAGRSAKPVEQPFLNEITDARRAF